MKNNELRPNEIPVGTAQDLTGKTFGKLMVLYRVANNGKTRGAKWRCKCSCDQHTIVDVLASNLKNGHTTSCGCLQKQITSEKHLKNLIGAKFGRLTVIDRAKDYISSTGKTRKVVWLCQCECGNIVEIEATSLQSRSTQSCGCIGRSIGEYKIGELLDKNNIPFQRQKKFNNCCFPDSNRPASFDFYVNNSYIIEFDGEQHNSFSPHGYFTTDMLKRIRERDQFKNKWCKDNNIPLIRIPYSQLNYLTIDDLQLDTSRFIYKQGEEEDEDSSING